MRWVLGLGLTLLVGCVSAPPEEEAAGLAAEAVDLAERGQTAEALANYERAIELVPGWTKVRFDYARLSFEKGHAHFFNALQADREAEDAQANHQMQAANDHRIRAETERQVAENLFQTAERELRRVVQMRTNRNHEFNGFLYLAHMYAYKGEWQTAKKYYTRAMRMGPQADAREPILEAIRLCDEEIDRESAEEIGPPPE